MNITEKTVDEWIAAHKSEMIEELKAWVRIPSVSKAWEAKEGAPYGADCRRMLDFALAEGRRYGFRTVDYDGYCGAIIYGDEEDQIGFVCHLDVVPEGDNWIYSPYEPTEEKGFLIARGIDDNKGSAISCLYVMKFFQEMKLPMKKGLRLMVGCAEETGMADFKYYTEVLHGFLPAFSIVADGGFPVCYGQKGGFDAAFIIPAGKNIVDFKAGLVRNAVPAESRLTVSGISLEAAEQALAGIPKVTLEQDGENIVLVGHGKAGHAAFQVHGTKNNAIVIAAEAAAVLEEKTGLDLSGVRFIRDAFVTPFGDGMGICFQDEESGELTLNAGVMRMQDGLMHLDIDIRYPVTCDAGWVREKMEQAARAAGASLTEVNISKPYYLDPQDPKIQVLMDVYRSVTGGTEEPYTMGGGTYSRVVPNALTFGPGLPKRHKADFLPEGHGGAHGPDESLNIEDWLTAFKIYILSVIRLQEM